MLRNNLIIFLILISTLVYSQHYKEKVKRLKLENCEECHTTKSWNEFKPNVKFDHKKTGFDLGFQHEKVECATCHTFKTDISKKKDCKSCHFDPHKEVLSSPESLSRGEAVPHPTKAVVPPKEPDNCESCHKETIWHKVEYKHEDFSKGFVLEGRHKDTTCIQCHKTQNYSNAKSDCISCHTTDYVRTKYPNHKEAKFNKDCVSCHTPHSWSQGRYYEHETNFPILSGTHFGYTCRTCHVNNDNYKDFSCTKCHEHSKSKTDKKHTGVSTYTYTPTSCYSCHPRG